MPAEAARAVCMPVHPWRVVQGLSFGQRMQAALAPGSALHGCVHPPNCSYEFCTDCGVDWHVGNTCEQYQEWRQENEHADEAFDAYHREHGSKHCPSCGHAAIKADIHSCNKMTCGRCRAFFCWVCGQRITGYDHFNHPLSPCYNKLFQGVPGHD